MIKDLDCLIQVVFNPLYSDGFFHLTINLGWFIVYIRQEIFQMFGRFRFFLFQVIISKVVGYKNSFGQGV